MAEKTKKKVGARIKNGQKKMSKIKNLKKLLKTGVFSTPCDENAHKSEKKCVFFVTIIFGPKKKSFFRFP